MPERINILKEFTGTTSRVVQKAASILEEEIAAGIVAVRQIEERFIDVDTLRSGKPELMMRFRDDAHQIIDIFLDLLTVATNYLGRMAENLISITGAEITQPPSAAAAPNFMIPRAIKAGSADEAPMAIENSSEEAISDLSFHITDLISVPGSRISARNITFTPSVISIAPKTKEKVMINVKVPAKTPSGEYAGLIQSTKMPQLKAVLSVQVE